MRVAFITQYFFPEQFSNNQIAQALIERGVDVDVVACVPNYPEGVFFEGFSNRQRRHEVWNGVQIHRAWTIARGKRAIQLVANYLGFIVFGTLLARRVARANRPDVSFVSLTSPILQALVGIFLKKRYRVPLVYWVQDIWPESATYTLGLRNPVIVKSLTWLCGWIYRQADLVLVQSMAFPPMIERFGIASEKIRVFPNTAAKLYEPIEPADAPDEGAMMPHDGFTIMFAGNIGESQDFDTIIEAAALLRARHQINWVILGSGRDLERVKRRVADTHIEDLFHFLGRHPEARMPLFFAHADAMLVSLRRNDIFALTVPYKVQSYMACGKPIIAALDGEGARIVREAGAGVSAPAQSPAVLAEQIHAMIETFETRRAAYARNSLGYFRKNYSANDLYNALFSYLDETVSEHGPKAVSAASRTGTMKDSNR